MAKLILRLISISILSILIINCAEQKVSPEKDFTLPEFSFVALSEPLSNKKNIKVSVHVEVPHHELQFTRAGDQFIARYEIGVNISDNKQERIAGSIWSDTLKLDSYQKTRKTDSKLTAVRSFEVPASELAISVRVTDLYTKKSRILTDGLDQSEMYVGELALGNILLQVNNDDGRDEVLMNQSYFEVLDTLRFTAKLMGQQHPYQVSYELFAKNEKKLFESITLDNIGPIDSLLLFEIALNDLHYSKYELFLTAFDGTGNKVTTKSKFGVRIRGVNFDVGDLEEAAKQLIYIASEQEIRNILSGSSDDEMFKFREYWAALDPTPGSVENELMDEYYRRVAFTLESFTVVQEGWKSDRGMIYILFGPPDEIQRGPFELDRKPYQVWDYFQLGKQFVFRDESGFGDYRLDQNYLDQNDWRFRY